MKSKAVREPSAPIPTLGELSYSFNIFASNVSHFSHHHDRRPQGSNISMNSRFDIFLNLRYKEDIDEFQHLVDLDDRKPLIKQTKPAIFLLLIAYFIAEFVYVYWVASPTDLATLMVFVVSTCCYFWFGCVESYKILFKSGSVHASHADFASRLSKDNVRSKKEFWYEIFQLMSLLTALCSIYYLRSMYYGNQHVSDCTMALMFSPTIIYTTSQSSWGFLQIYWVIAFIFYTIGNFYLLVNDSRLFYVVCTVTSFASLYLMRYYRLATYLDTDTKHVYLQSARKHHQSMKAVGELAGVTPNSAMERSKHSSLMGSLATSAEVQRNSEWAFMIANVAHDLKTVSNTLSSTFFFILFY